MNDFDKLSFYEQSKGSCVHVVSTVLGYLADS
jgi:hypothetical protein